MDIQNKGRKGVGGSFGGGKAVNTFDGTAFTKNKGDETTGMVG